MADINLQEIETVKSLSIKAVEEMTAQEKRVYFKMLKDYCQEPGAKYNNKITITQRIMSKIGPRLRNFPLEIYGQENVPKRGSYCV